MSLRPLLTDETGLKIAEAIKQNTTSIQKQAELESRMDAFTTLPEGSTTGDAELMDGRVSRNGEVYANIGDHIRGETGKLSEEIAELANLTDILPSLTLTSGFISNNLVVTSGDTYVYSNPILLKAGHKILLYGWAYDGVVSMITKCDANGNNLEALVIADSVDGWHTYTNASDTEIYVRVSFGVSDDHPIHHVAIAIANIEAYYNERIAGLKVTPEQTSFYKTYTNLNTGEQYLGRLQGEPKAYAVKTTETSKSKVCSLSIKPNTQYTVGMSELMSGSVMIVHTTNQLKTPTETAQYLPAGAVSVYLDARYQKYTFVSGETDIALYVQYPKNVTLEVFEGNDIVEKTIPVGVDVYSTFEVDDLLPHRQGLKIVHMGDSTSCLLDYPSLIKDGNTHYNVSANGAKIIADSNANNSGKNFKNLVDSAINRDYTKVDTVINITADQRVKNNLSLFKTLDFSEIDRCVFWFGANDYISNSAIGDESGTSYEEVIPALKYCIERLSTEFPNMKLYCVTPGYIHKTTNDLGNNLDSYIEAIVSVCKKLNVPVYNMKANGGVNEFNYTSRFDDIVHQNEEQNKIVAYKIRNFMEH